tara:strand:- start:411 stop:1604 length:1194 start_codon:yes stop_codon:yes gene_type:complete
MLNNDRAAEQMLVGMFRRKSTAQVEGEICPYCEFVNKLGSATCAQCYYELNKAPRDQGEPISTEVSDSIFDELMADDDDTWEEGDALEVVLTLDQDPLDVEQYEVTDFDSEEPEKIGFMESSSPELHDTVNHEPVEVHADDVGEEIKNVPKLEFSKSDPFDEVPEPIHQGKGAVFSPSTPSKVDDDLLGHVGGTELPSLPPDELYENKIDFTAKKAPAPTPAVVLPNMSKIAPASTTPVQLPTPVSEPVTHQVVSEPITNPAEPATQPVQQTVVEGIEASQTTEQGPEKEPVVNPPPDMPSRIWPWAESDAWDARQVHREVVSALELVKSGKTEEAASTIDTLGPHLTDENIDLIYHIGMVLKQLGRVDEVKAMLDKAKLAMPNNEHVSSAVTHLGV